MPDHPGNVAFQGQGPYALPPAQRATAFGGSNEVHMTLYCLIGDQKDGSRPVNVQMTGNVAKALADDLQQAAIDTEVAKPSSVAPMQRARARAFVEMIQPGDGPLVPESVTLVLQYDGKAARLEIPVGAPLYDREPGTEAYRRELRRILEALQEAAASPEGIYWPPRR